MARKRGFESKGKPAKFEFEKDFRKEVLAAKTKAGKIVGKEIVHDRIEALKDINYERIGGGIRNNRSRSAWHNKQRGTGALSRRRRQAVRSVVGKDGTLVALDHAPMAVIQETGGIIRSTGKLLKIQDGRRRAQGGGKKTFATKKGLVFEVAPHTKRKRNQDGTFRKNMKAKPKPRLVAVLKREVAIPRLPEKSQLDTIAQGKLERYRDLIDQFITQGFR